MGKALVINGLVVENSLGTVMFKDANSVLAQYLTANSSINEVETVALKIFVQSLIDANLWKKFYAFYPMLGNTVADMKLDAVDESKDLFMDKMWEYYTTEPIITNRMLDITSAVGTNSTKNFSGEKANLTSRFCAISSIYANGAAGVKLGQISGNSNSGARFMMLPIGYSQSNPQSNPTYNASRFYVQNLDGYLGNAPDVNTTVESALQNKTVFLNYDGTTITAKTVGIEARTMTKATSEINIPIVREPFLNMNPTLNTAVYVKFFAFTSTLTLSEMDTISGYLGTFLTAIGKDSI